MLKSSRAVSKSVLITVIVVVLVICVIAAGFMAFQYKPMALVSNPTPSPALAPMITPSPTPAPTISSASTPTSSSAPSTAPSPSTIPEEITIQAVMISVSTNTEIYLEQTGGPLATINGLIIKNDAGTVIGTVALVNGDISRPPSSGTLGTTLQALFTVYIVSHASPAGLSAGTYYTVTVVTAAGENFVSPSVIATP